MAHPASADYVRVLARWADFALANTFSLPDTDGLLGFGRGSTNHWVMQTWANACAALAVLGTEAAPPGDGAELRETALGLLRGLLATHKSGDCTCTDGMRWGHTWISSLALERAMHGVDALEPYLDEADRAALRRVMVSESDYLLGCGPIVAGIDVRYNKPESNIWNGCMLHRTALYYPDDARCGEWRERGTRYLANGLSRPEDETAETPLSGRALREWHHGPNFTARGSLDHHGYLNVGYMVICFSNLAMLHFSCRLRGLDPPEALGLHVVDQWRTLKRFVFPDGRLLRIGGDTRVRYCYCQDYAIPMWILMQDEYGDADAAAQEQGWLGIVEHEMTAHGDRTFLGPRLAGLKRRAPQYYLRLEGDRATTLAMGAFWRRGLENGAIPARGDTPGLSCPATGDWDERFHGACLVRSDTRAASSVWRAGEGPVTLCVPPHRSDLAEWQYNLAGAILTAGEFLGPEDSWWDYHAFPGGYLSFGAWSARALDLVGENEDPMLYARFQNVYAALPDGRTLIGLQHAVLTQGEYIRSVRGMRLLIPNDVFNDGVREYRADGRVWQTGCCPAQAESVATGSKALTVDGALTAFGIYGGEGLTIYRPGGREIVVRHHYKGYGNVWNLPSLYADEICTVFEQPEAYRPAGDTLIDTGFGVACADAPPPAFSAVSCDEPHCRAVRITGYDGVSYVLAANLGPACCPVPAPGSRGVVLAGAAGPLGPGRAVLVQE
ncbi:MAG: hypothetical protein JXR94_21395 [Candidatus Hydrogenedentes bacterium]|nr:hypothetical protein [Candidatus Hydrogenedentota bacterium]